MTLEAAAGNPSAVLPSASLWPSCFTSLMMTLLQQCYEVLFHSGALDHRTKVDYSAGENSSQESAYFQVF